MTKFLPVAMVPDSVDFLYELLKERKSWQNISHVEVPSYEDHKKFVYSEPYEAWYLIEDGGIHRGSIYITDRREVGLFLCERFVGMGYGTQALDFMEKTHGLPLYANVSLRNAQSMAFFVRKGYELLQATLRKNGGDS